MAWASPNKVTASSNDTPCLRGLRAALALSHSKVNTRLCPGAFASIDANTAGHTCTAVPTSSLNPYNALISTLRNLTTPAAYCNAIGPLASLLSLTLTVCTPLNTSVSSVPRAVTR